MKFYKYVTLEVAKIIISDGTLKFTSPVNFNDPFDFHPAALEKGLKKFTTRINNEVGNGLIKYKTNHRETKKTYKHFVTRSSGRPIHAACQ